MAALTRTLMFLDTAVTLSDPWRLTMGPRGRKCGRVRHNPPLLIRSTGQADWLDGGGPVLGVFHSASYKVQQCRLELGDTLVLYSNAVTEAASRREEEFGEERLLKTLAEPVSTTAQGAVDAVKRALAEWSAGAAPADDITLVVARRNRPEETFLPASEAAQRALAVRRDREG